MPTQISCSSCGRALRIPDDLLGQQVRCPSCNLEFLAVAGPGAEAGIQQAPDHPPPPPPRGDEGIREGEPPESLRPLRPPRPPHYDDYEDDDDDYPRRRRFDRDYALSKVAGPANGLLAVGWIGIVLTVLGAGFRILGAAAQPGPNEAAIDAAAAVISIPISLACSILIVVAATKMKRLESLGLAKAGAIVAMIPCISPCCILGIPFGWQALNALGDRDVIAAFNAGPASRLDEV
jgi:hypothetical protein